MQISVVLPAYNEEKNIAKCVNGVNEYLLKRFGRYEILVVDDGSNDDTARLVKQMATKNHRIKLVQHRQNRGHGAALKTGFAEAKGRLVFYTDADNQFDINDLDRLLPFIEKYDLVTGYRLHYQGPPGRYFIFRANNWIMCRLFGLEVKDIDCSFKLFRKEVFERIKLKSETGFIDTEMYVKARQAGLSLAQVGVKHFPRSEGETSYEAGGIWRRLALIKPGVIIDIFKEMKQQWRDLKN